ncbi:MAG: NUDIX domain-containing protein [Parcubacteria group bacterium]|jgi:ADP-ribose pyrophosphatase YjhB (NUDIX family)
MSKNIEIISRAFIVKEGEVLLCKVKSKDNYFFPGGHVEYGEKVEDALKRELKEEIGKELENINFIGICENTFQFMGEHQEINLVFEAEINDDKLEVLEDHMEFGWFSFNRIESMNVLPEKLKKEFLKWIKNKKIFYIV